VKRCQRAAAGPRVVVAAVVERTCVVRRPVIHVSNILEWADAYRQRWTSWT
jgi:hypothetical protein